MPIRLPVDGALSKAVRVIPPACIVVFGQVACRPVEPASDPSTGSSASRASSIAPGDPAPGPADPPRWPGSAPTPDERALILDAYRRFWAVAPAVSRQPPQTWRRTLAAVSADPLLSHLVDGLAEQRAKGLIDYGTVVPHPSIVGAEEGRASIVDCQDASRTGTLDLDTGIAASVGEASTPLAAVVERGRDGRWRLTEARYLAGSC